MSLNDFNGATRSLLDAEWACQSSGDWSLLNTMMAARLRGAMSGVRAVVVHSEDSSHMLDWFNAELHVATSVHALSVLYTDGKIDPNPWLRAVLELQPDARWVYMAPSDYKKLEADNNPASEALPPWDHEISKKYCWWLWSGDTRRSLGTAKAIVPQLVIGLWQEAYRVRITGAASERVRRKANVVALGEVLLGRHMEAMEVSIGAFDRHRDVLEEAKTLQDSLMRTYFSPLM
ncbi:hypothetical protein DFP72DRAFT_1076694 [Ephemerocybe angulata]|uniref:Uncharacterized protein n=1 Tax=Ephemerocybe angulata TaxID=980116 RepID=A0A8H6HH84_9AGAR|nr:hypothetical protein DFP72DRAFT_1076694 [Tulosesus angulatus]